MTRVVRILRWAAVLPVAWIMQALLSVFLIQFVNMMPAAETTAVLIAVWGFVSLGLAAFVGGLVAPSHKVVAAALTGGVLLAVQLGSLTEMGHSSNVQLVASWGTLAAGLLGVAAAVVVSNRLEHRKARPSSLV